MQVIDEKVDLEYFNKFDRLIILFTAGWSTLAKGIEKDFVNLDNNQYDNNEFIKLNADYNKDLMGKLGINAIPALIVIKNGRIIEKMYGGLDVKKIKELI